MNEQFPPVVRYLRYSPTLWEGRGEPYGMVVGYRKGMIGWCLCHPNDTFSKHTGRMICYNRAAMRIKNWRARLMRQALAASMGIVPELARHWKWESFQKMCPRMAKIIMLIEEVEEVLSGKL